MQCPFCNHPDTAVKDSRTTDDLTAIRRRRSCPECGSRFTTFEHVHLRDLTVIKKDGRKIPFDRDKLVRSVSSAMHKHALDLPKIEKLVSSVIRQLELWGDSDIPSTQIGEMVMQRLYDVDPVAYVRFASIYQKFSSIQDFIHCISSMQHEHEQESGHTSEEKPLLTMKVTSL